MFDDSALNRIVFVALLVYVERVILEAGNDIKDRLILTNTYTYNTLSDSDRALTELTCKHRLGSNDGHLA